MRPKGKVFTLPPKTANKAEMRKKILCKIESKILQIVKISTWRHLAAWIKKTTE